MASIRARSVVAANVSCAAAIAAAVASVDAASPVAGTLVAGALVAGALVVGLFPASGVAPGTSEADGFGDGGVGRTLGVGVGESAKAGADAPNNRTSAVSDATAARCDTIRPTVPQLCRVARE